MFCPDSVLAFSSKKSAFAEPFPIAILLMGMHIKHPALLKDPGISSGLVATQITNAMGSAHSGHQHLAAKS